ncbi:MAG: threonine synthase, partial [Oscillospiraceae bacterium]|nr:threonine synthase [Oscillospiraceae bacterium]
KGWILSSANSINWGRLLPQVVYYFSAYADLVNNGAVKAGEKVNFCVPTGNFGDILAGYYARKMGLPVGRLICASNRNDVLTEFINTGVYDRNRPFYETTSPSMDILVSSNLERLLFDLAGDDVAVASFMARLSKTGRYAVPESVREGVQAVFSAGSLTDLETGRVIGDTFRDRGYLMDTHTAVAAGVLEKYRAQTGDRTLTVVLSTASPFKFTEAVLTALGEVPQDKGPQLIDRLTEVTGVEAPAPLAALKGKTPRFEGTLYKDELLRAVRDFLE